MAALDDISWKPFPLFDDTIHNQISWLQTASLNRNYAITTEQVVCLGQFVSSWLDSIGRVVSKVREVSHTREDNNVIALRIVSLRVLMGKCSRCLPRIRDTDHFATLLLSLPAKSAFLVTN